MTLTATTLSITALYAGLLGLLSIVLAGLAGRARVVANVSLGDGGKPELIEAIRRHANFTEFVPLFLVLLAIVEIKGAPAWWLHVMGATTVIARVIHPFGLSYTVMNTTARAIGAAGTFIPTIAASLTALWLALAR